MKSNGQTVPRSNGPTFSGLPPQARRGRNPAGAKGSSHCMHCFPDGNPFQRCGGGGPVFFRFAGWKVRKWESAAESGQRGRCPSLPEANHQTTKPPNYQTTQLPNHQTTQPKDAKEGKE